MAEIVFRLPDVGEGLAEAEVVEWLVSPGAAVRADQPVVTVETAKAQVELPAPADGTIRELARAVGDMVPVGEPLFVLETAAATVPATRNRVLAAPSTRRLAVEHGVDLTTLTGSGPNGRIVPDDVMAAVAAPLKPEPEPEPEPVVQQAPVDTPDTEVRPLRGLRRQTAKAMTAALAVPHITEFREVDATELERAHALLRGDAAARGARLTLLPLLVRVLVAALRRHPELNATFDPDRAELTVHRRLHVGIATATRDGLVVPVLRDAGPRGVPGLGREIARLVEAARERTLTPRDTTGATFTVSNFGSYGTWLGTPLISPPQVAIAGFGRVRDAVVPVDGAPAVRRVLPLAVAADHRVLDGADLGAFVATLERLVTQPLLLLGEDG
ncbi:dihydrolipoamide acetyltransferase family protein [Pseudonocardia aurantiaca]|uniref:Dihydrolipoamide acetyltransferase component of pyruvate dehydrogenase complex n=1 Tax=Pseudonocardia aurantiaca TaxID=75290 RepID=A0ABW4FHX8_9PSEU